MTIDQKISKMHKGKSFALCEGVSGSGNSVWIIYTENKEGAVHGETFKNKAEALRWWQYSCN